MYVVYLCLRSIGLEILLIFGYGFWRGGREEVRVCFRGELGVWIECRLGRSGTRFCWVWGV